MVHNLGLTDRFLHYQAMLSRQARTDRTQGRGTGRLRDGRLSIVYSSSSPQLAIRFPKVVSWAGTLCERAVTANSLKLLAFSKAIRQATDFSNQTQCTMSLQLLNILRRSRLVIPLCAADALIILQILPSGLSHHAWLQFPFAD